MLRNKMLVLLAFFILVGMPIRSQQQQSQNKSNKSIQVNPNILDFNFDDKEDFTTAIQILIIITILTLAPSIIIMMTSFTRIIIVFHFLRQALGTQQMPPNQVMIGLALFITFYVMLPTLEVINEKAVQPYLDGKIKQQVALKEAEGALREFMFKNLKDDKELSLFISFTNDQKPQTRKDVSTWSLIPAFIVSELKIAFQMGFLIYVPFLIIDMVVSSILMTMGMMMLPPMMISLPFKLILFVLVDGWYLLIQSLVLSFR
jgi:flagellar biosynthesis protein FliP